MTHAEIENIVAAVDVFENIDISLVDPVTAHPASVTEAWHLNKINIEVARKLNLTGRGVRIGILDTGIDASHEEFAGKHVSFAEFDDAGIKISSTPRDLGEHGTHVAGIASGRHFGVAPDADLAVAAVLTQKNGSAEFGGKLAQILGGYNWLISPGHDVTGDNGNCPVINASFGASGYHSYLYSAVENQHTISRRSLMIAAIGNTGELGINGHWSPGNYDLTLGVGAVDADLIVPQFSDWGLERTHNVLKPDLCAPGVDICSAVPHGQLRIKSGTSMASPMVAGAAALLIEQDPNLAHNPATLKESLLRLVNTSTVSAPENSAGGFSRIGSGSLDLTGI